MPHAATNHPTRVPITVGRLPNARTVEGRQRQTLHRIVRELGYSDAEYRTMLGALTSSRYARDLDTTELAFAITVLNGFLDEKRLIERPYKLEAVSDDIAAGVLA